MTFRLDYYDAAELGTIVRRSARILDVEIADDAADEIARRSRGTPRIANRILRRVRDVAQVKHDGVITNEVAHGGARAARGRRLRARADRPRAARRRSCLKFGGGPVGLSTLAVALGEEPDTIEDVYEPYLLQLGFLQRTPRGRIVTELRPRAARRRLRRTTRSSFEPRPLGARRGRAVARRLRRAYPPADRAAIRPRTPPSSRTSRSSSATASGSRCASLSERAGLRVPHAVYSCRGRAGGADRPGRGDQADLARTSGRGPPPGLRPASNQEKGPGTAA